MHIILIFIWIFSIFSANAEINQNLPIRVQLLDFENKDMVCIPYCLKNKLWLVNPSENVIYIQNIDNGFKYIKFDLKPLLIYTYNDNINIITENNKIIEYDDKLGNNSLLSYMMNNLILEFNIANICY